MQKKIIALAVAAVASGAAFAQSNVTISGNLNYQWENISGSSPTMSTSGVATNVPQMPPRRPQPRQRERFRDQVLRDRRSGQRPQGHGRRRFRHYPRQRCSPPPTATAVPSAAVTPISACPATSVPSSPAACRCITTPPTRSMASSWTPALPLPPAASSAASAAATTLRTGGYGLGAGGRLGSTVAYVTPTVSGFNGTIGYTRPNAPAPLPMASSTMTAASPTPACRPQGVRLDPQGQLRQRPDHRLRVLPGAQRHRRRHGDRAVAEQRQHHPARDEQHCAIVAMRLHRSVLLQRCPQLAALFAVKSAASAPVLPTPSATASRSA